MVNSDSSSKTFDFYASTENRNTVKPLKGFRKNLGHLLDTQVCPFDPEGSGDRILPGYQECSFELTKKQFERNNFEPIVLYVDTPRAMYSFIETCQTGG